MKKILNNFYVKNVLLVLLIILIMFVQMLYAQEFELEKNIIIKALYITTCLGAMVYGFITTRYFTLNQLSFGKTRKEIYFDYLKRVLIILVYVLMITITYIVLYLIIYQENHFHQLFKSSRTLYYISCYLLFSSIGYFQGIFKLKTWIFVLITFILTICLMLLLVLRMVNIWISLIIFIIALSFLVVNYILINNLNIKE